MDMSLLVDSAGIEGQTEGALEGGARHGGGGGGRSPAVAGFSREQQGGMAMSFPLLAQELESAQRQRHIAIGIALARPNVQEHPFGIDVAHLQAQPFAQAQAAGIDRGQADPMIQGADLAENRARLVGREHDGQFALGIGPDQFQFQGPVAEEGFLPKQLDLPALSACAHAQAGGRQVAQRAWVEVWRATFLTDFRWMKYWRICSAKSSSGDWRSVR